MKSITSIKKDNNFDWFVNVWFHFFAVGVILIRMRLIVSSSSAVISISAITMQTLILTLTVLLY